MKTIIVSPHFDDAALSCGGWIYDSLQRGEEMEVWTICAGHPADDDFSALAVEFHANWALTAGEVIETRRGEDRTAMQVLGVPYRHFSFADAIYRKHPRSGEHLYPDVESLFGGLHPGDQDIMQLVAVKIAESLPEGEVRLVSPLTVGNHADHLLVRGAVEMLAAPVWYYPDYPYTRAYPHVAALLAPSGFSPHAFKISPRGLAIWQSSVAAYASQISSFWASEEDMRQGLVSHMEAFNGITIWRRDTANRR
ncbi:MAG: PIG-L family deacetylase [Anaerolineales bacterium]|nr:PIG-L family deacetylase [Anaerolineales bacterium]